jgi:hypothetical protein
MMVSFMGLINWRVRTSSGWANREGCLTCLVAACAGAEEMDCGEISRTKIEGERQGLVTHGLTVHHAGPERRREHGNRAHGMTWM